jgi:hypothetical protein
MNIDRKDVPITDQAMVDHMTHINLDPTILSLPEGDALCHQSISATVIVAEQPNGCGKFAMIIAVADFHGRHLGSLSPMTATEARNFAASLIDAANQIEGRGGLS